MLTGYDLPQHAVNSGNVLKQASADTRHRSILSPWVMDPFSSMRRVLCTWLNVVLMDHELDARPSKLMLQKHIYHNSSSSISLFFIHTRASGACMHTLFSGTVTPTYTGMFHNFWTARYYSSPNRGDGSFLLSRCCQVTKNDRNSNWFSWKPHSELWCLWTMVNDMAEAICMSNALGVEVRELSGRWSN